MSQQLLDQLAGLARGTRARVFLVGGYLRDKLLSREPVDLDLLVEGDPGPFLDALSREAGFDPVVFSRKEPITYRVAMGEWLIDISSFPAGRLEKELTRRDLTINALAAPIESPAGPLVDPAGGLDDLRSGRLRYVTEVGLDDDPLRLLRVVRLTVVLEGFEPDRELRDAIRRRAPKLAEVAAERVLAEMEVILASPRAGKGLRLMESVGLLRVVFPELSRLAGLQQNRWHRHDALEHTLRAVEEADLLQARSPSPWPGPQLEDAEVLKWAALLHDTGKAATAARGNDGEVHFYGHETVSADIARRVLDRLRMATRKAERIVVLVSHHLRLTLLSAGDAPSDKSLRRLIHQVKYDTPLLCLLALADRRAGGGPDFEDRLRRLSGLITRVMEIFGSEADRVIAPQALLTGHEVMAILGIGSGPRVGTVLRWLQRLQVEGHLKNRDEARKLLRDLPAAKLLTLDDEA